MTEQLKNPVTDAEFKSFGEYIDSLTKSWQDLQIQQYQLDQSKAAILAVAVNAAKEASPDTVRGSVKLEGVVTQLKVVFKQSASYPRERGAVHPLRLLAQDFPELEDMIRVDIEESGSKIEKFLERGDYDDHERELAEKLRDIRIVKDGKPSLEAVNKD
jgi:hypothetical protein